MLSVLLGLLCLHILTFFIYSLRGDGVWGFDFLFCFAGVFLNTFFIGSYRGKCIPM